MDMTHGNWFFQEEAMQSFLQDPLPRGGTPPSASQEDLAVHYTR